MGSLRTVSHHQPDCRHSCLPSPPHTKGRRCSPSRSVGAGGSQTRDELCSPPPSGAQREPQLKPDSTWLSLKQLPIRAISLGKAPRIRLSGRTRGWGETRLSRAHVATSSRSSWHGAPNVGHALSDTRVTSGGCLGISMGWAQNPTCTPILLKTALWGEGVADENWVRNTADNSTGPLPGTSPNSQLWSAQGSGPRPLAALDSTSVLMTPGLDLSPGVQTL